MKTLWLTLADPVPAVNGQFIYSAGLIASAADAGATLTVVGLERPDGNGNTRRHDRVDYILSDDRPLASPWKLLSPLPGVATWSRVPGTQAALSLLLADDRWDAVVFDSIAWGWALPAVRRYRSRWPVKLAYLAHNVETNVARRIARATAGARRIVREVEVWKVRSIERALVAACDLVTCDAPEDRHDLEAMTSRQKSVVFLAPGYAGNRVPSRTIDADSPRRAVAVGSFDWAAKRSSLEAFLKAGLPLLERAGCELQVVGDADPRYLEEMRRRFPTVEFTGRVEDVRPYMAGARLAVVPDLIGGFKLKTLDYVFNRVPILGMAGALPGTPLVDRESIRLFNSHEALARGVIVAMDDVASLNAQQNRAYAACADCFDWDRTGRLLVDTLRGLPLRGRRNAAVVNGMVAGAERA